MLILVLCLGGPLRAEEEADESEPMPDDAPASLELFLHSYNRIDGVMRDFTRSSKKTFTFDFVPKFLQVRASYWERRADGQLSLTEEDASDTSKWGRYFDLLAKSSPLDGKLVAESEVAYSTTGLSHMVDEQPLMTRLGINGRWGKVGYGLLYRSFGRGFVPLAAAKVEHDREENQIWAEYDFGLFRMRGSAGDTWEQEALTRRVTFTRTALTSFHVNKPTWSVLLSTSYSEIDRSQTASAKSLAYANGINFVYRPLPLLTLEPNLAFKHEWEPMAGAKIDTPSAGFAFTYKPWRELQLVGRTSYMKNSSEDPLRDTSLVNTAAGLNWKLGKSFIGEQSISLQVEYRNESSAAAPDNQQNNVIGTIQFKVANF